MTNSTKGLLNIGRKRALITARKQYSAEARKWLNTAASARAASALGVGPNEA